MSVSWGVGWELGKNIKISGRLNYSYHSTQIVVKIVFCLCFYVFKCVCFMGCGSLAKNREQ